MFNFEHTVGDVGEVRNSPLEYASIVAIVHTIMHAFSVSKTIIPNKASIVKILNPEQSEGL